MAAIDPRVSRWLLWLAPFAVLALVLGLQTDWGRALRRPLPPEAPVAPAPVTASVLPEFRVEGGVDALRATVERPLFNATRRPAPPAVAEAPKPTIQRGQFVLAGTMIVDQVAIAYLREAGGGGKSRSVRLGETINGMKVAEVTPDRVRLALGEEFEDLDLKVAKGPKVTAPAGVTTVGQAQAAAAPAAAAAVPAGAQPPRGGRVRGGVAQAGAPGTDGAENLRAARRAAREAERAAAAAAPQDPAAAAAAAAAAQPPTAAQSWDNTYRNMRNRTR